MEIDNIYNMDCLEGMRQMESESVDLTVTSPPYDNLRKYNGFCFDFENVAKQLYRVTKEGGVVVWVVGDATIDGSETGTSFRQALYFMECGFNLHDTMIWAKDGGGAVGSNLAYTQNFEYMFVFSKGRPKTTNLIKDKRNMSFGCAAHVQQGRRMADGSFKVEHRKETEFFSKRNNWWLLVPGKEECSEFHPAVFPKNLPPTTSAVGATKATLCSTPLWAAAQRQKWLSPSTATTSALKSLPNTAKSSKKDLCH